MKISVVIPAYNEEKYIAKCLESLMKQTVLPDEIIVVDNNSTDATHAIASRFPVTIISQKHIGITPTRNAGFDAARYEIIARLDADSYAPENWLKKLSSCFYDKKILAVGGVSYFYDAQFPALATKIQTFVYFKISKLLLGHDIVQGPNLAIRKSAWNKVKNECCHKDADVHEDIDLAMHLSKYGEILFDPDLIVYVSARRFHYNKESLIMDYIPKWFRTMYFYDHILHLQPSTSTKMKTLIRQQMGILNRMLEYIPLIQVTGQQPEGETKTND